MAPQLVDNTGLAISSFPKVADVFPTGVNIVIEVLNQQEATGTSLTLAIDKKKFDPSSPQAYVRKVGPQFKSDDYGFKVGDRVMLSTGAAYPVPQLRWNDRDVLIVEPHGVKAVLSETN